MCAEKNSFLKIHVSDTDRTAEREEEHSKNIYRNTMKRSIFNIF